MANTNTQASRVITGMLRDFHPMNMGEGSYDFALNARIENFDGTGLPIIQNETSNILCTGFPEGYFIVGFVNVVEQERVIWFLANPETGGSEIGETKNMSGCKKYAADGFIEVGCDDCKNVNLSEGIPLEELTQNPCCVYRTIKNQDCLNFNRNFPVDSVEYRINACDLEIFFTDNNNGRRHLIFEYINDDVTDNLKIKQEFFDVIGFEIPPCEVPIYSEDLDCNRLNIQPNFSTPCIEFIDLVSGGSNKAGVYQFFIAFSDIDGNKLSSYFSSTNPIPVRTKDVTFETDYVTDRAIALEIRDLDITGAFEYYKLAVAKTINSFTSFYEVGVFPVTQHSYSYTGNNEAEVKLTSGDIFQRLPFYKTAGHVTASNNILFWADLAEFPKLNLQRVANNINLQWQTIAIPEAVYRNPRNVNKFRGYMRDEVYPFGIVFIYENGEESSVYHIPGREPITTDLDIIDNADAIKEKNCLPCADEVEGDEQLTLNVLNTINCTGGGSDIVLVIDNSFQASACPLTPHSDTGCTPTTVIGTPPFVNAGVDQTINYYGPVSLNGTALAGSSPIIATVWTQLSGPNTVSISNPGLLNTFFQGYNTGTYVFQLCATDTAGNISADTVQFDVTIPVNVAPVTDPGPDKIIALPTSDSYLNGGASTDTDGIATFAWSQLSGPNTAVISSPSSVYTTVTGLIEGTYKFQLIVTDVRGCSSPATTLIYVLADPSGVPPACSSDLLYPVNGTITSSFATVVLDWEDAPFATSYDVYLRTDIGVFALQGNVTDSNFTLTNLDPNTIYHWYIVPKNAAGSAVNCQDCYRSFVTPTASSIVNCQKKRWEVYNTATIEGGELELYEDCEETCYQFGNFSYWESTERYPNIPEIWGSLCGRQIRHHKFPDSFINHIHDGLNGTQDYSINNIVYPIGVKVDHDSVRASIAAAVTAGIFTQAEADRIVSYRIVRGNRFQNKSIVAKGVLYDVNQYRRKLNGTYFDNQNIYFANYPYNDLRSNPFVTDDFRNYDEHNTPKGADLPFIPSKRYTFHSPDTHFSEPSIGSKLKLETVEYGQSEGYFTKSKKQAKQRFLSNASYAIAFTGGIIAALLKTHVQEIREYTVKGSIVSAMGVAAGELGPFLPYIAGPGAATTFESTIDAATNLDKAGSIFASTDATTRTVRGKPIDWINPIYLATKQPLLLPLFPLMVANYIAGFLTTIIEETQIIVKLIESLTPFRDWTVQYNSVGKYNRYKSVPNTGNKLRSIISSSYLKGENTLINEPSETTPNQFNTVKMNNWNREGSVYLKYEGDEFPDASTFSGIQDQSRFTLEEGDVSCNLDKRIMRPISSYYASIKNFVPDQYGTIYNIEYLPTDSCVFEMDASNDDCRTVYGGDTFINRFGLKIKAPYFLATTFNLPHGTDFNFEEFANLGVPRHYYNSTLGVGSEFDDINDILSLLTPSGLATFLGRPKSIRDCSTNKFFYQNGYIYLYHYGIPYFLVESDVNVDYRHAENLKEKAFYPVQGDLDFWLQEENVPMSEDNTYFYNRVYSKQNKEMPFIIDPPSFEPSRDCRVDHPNRIIYATGGNWLVYKANDFFDFPLSKGNVTSIEGIENETVLVRTINSTSVFKSILRTQVSGQTVQVGNGGIFSNPPQEFAETTLGYIGSQHKAILHTEFGHIWADAKRGQVFNISAGGNGTDELAKDGMKNWFKENLPFQIARDFPNISEDDIDNNFIGIGLTMSFDKRNNRFFLTKLDYKKRDNNLTYDAATKEFKVGATVVRIGDKRYFTDKSWTVSYNFISKSWVSFYSFKPNYYLDFIDYFGSGQEDGFWLHNMTNSSFQVFYGKLQPFIVEPILKFDAYLKALNSIEFDTEVRRYKNEFDYTVKKSLPGFNKTIVYNDMYNSGNLNLVKTDKNDLTKVGKYPVRNFTDWDIEVTLANFKWRFNQFYNLVRDNSEIPLWLYKGNNAEKSLNQQAFNYKKADFDLSRLKGQWFKIMMINDKTSNYKILHKFSLDSQTVLIK
jgi:hypothetical protein